MKIYTKRGDEGQTDLYGGMRVAKDATRIRAYGGVDELNAVLSIVAASAGLEQEMRNRVLRIQNELFHLGAELATPRGKDIKTSVLENKNVEALEVEIDEMEKILIPLKSFILPGGSLTAAHCHLARTVCRRTEREIAGLHRAEPLRPVVLQYVNRLSDYLFVLARWLNHQAGEKDVLWNSKT